MPVSEERPPPFPDEPWANADTERWLIAAFRLMPYTPVYAPRGNTLESVDPQQPSATFNILAFTGTVLGDRSLARHVLLVWARSVATKGGVGGSIAEFCNETGLNRRQFDRMRTRAVALVTRAKNAADGRLR